MKQDISKQIVNDLINIVGGTSTSGKLVNIMTFMFKSLSIQQLKRHLLDDIINMFVMLYLKSNLALKKALVTDLENIFLLIKQKETFIFVDRKFKLKIMFHCIN